MPSKEEMAEKTRGLDDDQRRVLDIAIKYAKNIVKARSKGKARPEPPHLIVHGAAGTGIYQTLQMSKDTRFMQYLIFTEV